jgi:glutamate/tyrosine decarboxylase-like PLP-dependent enzyme
MVLFRDPDVLLERFRVPLPYMQPSADLINIGEISVHGTQHADVLKLWLSLLFFGRKGFADLIDASCALGRRLADAIEACGHLEIAARPDTNIVCFRPAPQQGRSQAEQDQCVRDLRRVLLERHGIFVSVQPLRGGNWIRVVPLNPYSGQPEIERLLVAADEASMR